MVATAHEKSQGILELISKKSGNVIWLINKFCNAKYSVISGLPPKKTKTRHFEILWEWQPCKFILYNSKGLPVYIPKQPLGSIICRINKICKSLHFTATAGNHFWDLVLILVHCMSTIYKHIVQHTSFKH